MAWASGFIAGGFALILLEAALGITAGVGWWGVAAVVLAIGVTAADCRG